MTPAEAYANICVLARNHALVLEAVGGVITIVHPDVQREEGLYCHVQWVHGKGPHPDSGGHCKCKLDGKGACKELA